jgi:hypothetical protein
VLTRSRQGAQWLLAGQVAATTAIAFTQSYRGLYVWAASHGVPAGWLAASWPVMVDAFMAGGEIGLFIGLSYQWRLTSRLGSWVSFGLGFVLSLAFNIGGVTGRATDHLTAGIPPLAAAVSLAIGLGILKRVLASMEEQPATVVAEPAAGVAEPQPEQPAISQPEEPVQPEQPAFGELHLVDQPARSVDDMDEDELKAAIAKYGSERKLAEGLGVSRYRAQSLIKKYSA